MIILWNLKSLLDFVKRIATSFFENQQVHFTRDFRYFITYDHNQTAAEVIQIIRLADNKCSSQSTYILSLKK